MSIRIGLLIVTHFEKTIRACPENFGIEALETELGFHIKSPSTGSGSRTILSCGQVFCKEHCILISPVNLHRNPAISHQSYSLPFAHLEQDAYKHLICYGHDTVGIVSRCKANRDSKQQMQCWTKASGAHAVRKNTAIRQSVSASYT